MNQDLINKVERDEYQFLLRGQRGLLNAARGKIRMMQAYMLGQITREYALEVIRNYEASEVEYKKIIIDVVELHNKMLPEAQPWSADEWL